MAIIYEWKGKNPKGRRIKGEMEAETPEQVRTSLERRKITPTRVRKKPKDIFENISFLAPKVKESDIIIFARQFSTMIDAGLPLLQCLDILCSQQENPTFKKQLKHIKESVESGETFADALKKYPKTFNELFINMISAGEAGGILDVILQRLSAYAEKMAKLKKQVKGAMTYPAITLAVAVIVVGVILVFVIPVFEKMFSDMGSALPIPTQMVVTLSNFVVGHIIWIILGVIGAVFLFRQTYKSKKGRIFLDDLFLRLPVIGLLIRKVAVAKFTRTTATMMSSGVSILEALDIVGKTAGNKIIEFAISDVKVGISEGRSMADPLLESGVFPSMVCSMIAVGESTGALDVMMTKIADFYDDEVDQAVKNLTDMIEPFMLVFLGVVVGGLVIAMYLPIFSMAAAVG
ncbi:type II secretion system F family protein [Desulfobacter sp.]|uniref:type II secretion system F family protein n=1 Tax=Desulfobacter sp. TaxID=2294 RepID=UPI000E9530CF|nr:type II secretion system F family protein [Desulfobacter sp.]MBP8829213.1 type II secretion system F family protein [Desulfobacter sp.]MBP9599003.1 type II secretion system F family protein [Desulfobacter sp.]MDQ1270689.1 type pilus assembly protein PilC [Thermodesulfobacteriota bacterium]HBT87119.1 pilus assembly protein PilC [Desulfobacter sp.]